MQQQVHQPSMKPAIQAHQHTCPLPDPNMSWPAPNLESLQDSTCAQNQRAGEVISPCQCPGDACSVLSSSKPCNQAKTMQSQPYSPHVNDSLHTHIWGGSRQGYPKCFLCWAACGNAFLHMVWGTAQGWIQLHVEKGQKEAAQLLPTKPSERPALADLSPKTWSQIKQKGLIKPPNLSPLRSSLNTCKLQPIQAPQVAFCLLQGTAYIPGETANGMLAGQLCPLSLNMPAQQWGEGQGKPTKKSWCSSGDCSPAWKLCQARCGYCPGILFPCPQNRPSLCHSHPSALDRRAIISHFSHAVPLCLFTFMTIPLLILLSQ